MTRALVVTADELLAGIPPDLIEPGPLWRGCDPAAAYWPRRDQPRWGTAKCGTDAGYWRHRRLRETNCDACRKAHSQQASRSKDGAS